MDSVTQIALGATVAATAGYKPFGRKTLLAGAFLGTLPDLDVFIDYGNAVDNYTSHRGFSHSLLVLTAISIALYLIALKIKPNFHNHRVALFLVIFLPLITHPLLDSFTTYGTQLLWPLTSPPIAWHSIFIIDPLYTLPLLITVVCLWFSKNKTRWLKLNQWALIFSCGYLAWGQFSQFMISERVKNDNVAQHQPMLVMPTPFNSIYWRVLSYHQDSYYEAFTYLGDKKPLIWQRYETNRNLLNASDPEYLARLEWFSHGWLRFDEVNNELQITDLRLGVAGYHPFKFSIAAAEKEQEQFRWRAIEPQQIPMDKVDTTQAIEDIKNRMGLSIL
ncbi:metal-dependent hydrolase [Psychromonas sp. psych-6C06]|uniref:metal-dependent hydrolase n=1 Tax=Psychromonas sp. psych-6C06 TaxID=2058089 RepID=UPI00187C613C|nr:metal-dependent hydrolase [Psychromonas sp. psych-6C06]